MIRLYLKVPSCCHTPNRKWLMPPEKRNAIFRDLILLITYWSYFQKQNPKDGVYVNSMGHKIKHHEPPNLLLGSATYASQLMGAHYSLLTNSPSPLPSKSWIWACTLWDIVVISHVLLARAYSSALLETKVDREQIWPGCSSLSSARPS